MRSHEAVSYTHLDVYKRQAYAQQKLDDERACRYGEPDPQQGILRFKKQHRNTSPALVHIHARRHTSFKDPPLLPHEGYFDIKSSAICTALVAAPLRSWSPQHQRAIPFFSVISLRMRPTATVSKPPVKRGMG